jgi:hypothetical protein
MNEADLRCIGSSWTEAMRRGDYEAAWRQTDRIELPRRSSAAADGFVRQPYHLLWDGTAFDRRSVVIRCNHGLGDTLQYFRFVPHVNRLARALTIMVQPPLVEMLRGSVDAGQILNGWVDSPRTMHEVEIEIMELAYACRVTTATLPRRVPYLPVKHIREQAKALPVIRNESSLSIGLIWAGSDWDTSRSIPLNVLEPLLHVTGVRWYALQQGREAEAWRDLPVAIEPLSQHTGDVVTAAAAMLELDLIITVDAMPAHLAGALGRPVWVLLKHCADWRWMREHEDTPWYPTMRLFRQPRPGDWASVAHAAAVALEQTVRSRVKKARPSS